MMAEHVYRKFPNHIDAIQTLLQKDATFEEVCADYEEICTWLAFQKEPTVLSTEEIEYARELVRDLENDISKALREAGY